MSREQFCEYLERLTKRELDEHSRAYDEWRAQYYADQKDREEDERGDFR